MTADFVDPGGDVTVDVQGEVLELELEKLLSNLLSDDNDLRKGSEAAKNYVYSQAGATKKIMDYIQKNLLLTN